MESLQVVSALIKCPDGDQSLSQRGSHRSEPNEVTVNRLRDMKSPDI